MADENEIILETDPADSVQIHICADEDGRPQIGLVMIFEDDDGQQPSVHFDLKVARKFYAAFGEAITKLEKVVN